MKSALRFCPIHGGHILAALLAWFTLHVFLPCDAPAQSQMEMNATAAADLENADRELNALYQKLLKDNQDDPQFCRDLKEAQRAWLKFVEYHLKSSFPLKQGEDPRIVYGSIYPMEHALLQAELVRQRIAQLKQLSGEE